MMVKIHMLNKGYAQKPNKKEIAWISQNITKDELEISIDHFASEAGKNGKPFTPAVFRGSRQECNFSHQQVYGLDIDGDLKFEDFLDRAKEYQILPAFVYATYSYTEQEQRYRAIFINDCEIDNPQAARILLGMLLLIFPEADQNCKDLARLFFGGKGLLYLDSNAVINIKSVAIGLQAFVKNRDSKNYGRKIKAIGNKLGIAVEDNLLCVYDEYDIGENEEKWISSNNNLYVLNRNSSKYGIIYTTPDRQEGIRHKKSISCIQRGSQEDLQKVLQKLCPLMKDFLQRDIPHEHKFLLATNLLYIKGGKSLFFQGLKENIELWEIRWDYFIKREYAPESCKNGNCPYWNQCKCKNILEKLKSKIQRIQEEEKFVSLEEATEILNQNLTEALFQTEKKIYLIQAQTALGKTTAYCRIAREIRMNKPLMFVVPTNKLQREVWNSLVQQGIDAYATPDVRALFQNIGLKH
ncbi:MAG: hypothetical protein Q4C59_07320, partial [Lachnospiraceae bacterium]|nr:hypothetical protein [Lachnospiraceae bacterium]